jgi:hypothetical protein
MRLFFIQKAWGLFASSGEYRANSSFLRHVTSLGHATAQLCFALEGDVESCVAATEASGRAANLTKDEMCLFSDSGKKIAVTVSTFMNTDGIHIIALDGDNFRKAFPPRLYAKETTHFIEVRQLHQSHRFIPANFLQKGIPSAKLRDFMHRIELHLDAFQPTHVVFNDSLSLKATSTMLSCRGIRRVFVIHCAEQLPFGPYAGGLAESACSPKEHGLLRGVDGIWAVSKAIKDYAYEYGHLNATFLVHDPWTYLDEKTHQVPQGYNNWGQQLVGMVNPSPVKGVKILLQLAGRLPHVKFAVWLSWAFDETVRKQLEEVSNIE